MGTIVIAAVVLIAFNVVDINGVIRGLIFGQRDRREEITHLGLSYPK